MSIQEDARPVVKTVSLTIDGVEVNVPEGTLVIRAAEEIGIQIPRFCDHPLLDPVGACRQCLVEVSTPDREGNLRPMPKPQASCTLAVSEGMEVKTQHTSHVADKAQQGVMELLLINHPLDCPVCDKGGECPLQNQAMSNGAPQSRFVDIKRTFPKPINISSQVLLDRERCVLCARCTRFSNEIAGDPFIALIERGALQQVGIYEEQPFESYFSGNTVQICPVGALTGAAYRFRSRPFDLVSTPSICEHCAGGCSLRVDHRRGAVLRRMALEDTAVNEEWNCDKGRWAFAYATMPDRLRDPVVRGADGNYQVVSWEVALRAAAAGLSRASTVGSGAGVLTGGRISLEDSYTYSKFARTVLGTNDVDFRARAQSSEEAEFLASSVVGTTEVTYAGLEEASSVLLVGIEAEEETAVTFLRLRKAVRRNGLKVFSVAPFATRGLRKLNGTLLSAAPGTEAEVLISLAGGGVAQGRVELGPTSVILVGERLASSPGALTAAAKLARSTGAALAWIPRRAGDRGALEAGALPTLLPGGRPVADVAARAEVEAIWRTGVPSAPGRDTNGIIAAAAAGQLSALVVGGVDPNDLPDPQAARAALANTFVVSLDFRETVVHEYADVILPIAPHQEKAGTFINWEGRERQFQRALESNARSDHSILDLIAAELGIHLGARSLTEVRREITTLGGWSGQATAPAVAPASPPQPGPGEAVLASWTHLLDLGSLQDGEPFLAGTARRTVARLSASTAAATGVADGDALEIATDNGSITVPLVVTDMPDHVVWVPANSRGSRIRVDLGVGSGSVVRIAPGRDIGASAGQPEGGAA